MLRRLVVLVSISEPLDLEHDARSTHCFSSFAGATNDKAKARTGGLGLAPSTFEPDLIVRVNSRTQFLDQKNVLFRRQLTIRGKQNPFGSRQHKL